MARKPKYRRLDDGNVEHFIFIETFTPLEFDDAKDKVMDRIDRIDDELERLIEVEVPVGASDEVEQAVAEFNLTHNYQERERLEMERKRLVVVAADMAEVD